VLNLLRAEHVEAAKEYFRRAAVSPAPEAPTETRLLRVQRLWSELFEGRTINLLGNEALASGFRTVDEEGTLEPGAQFNAIYLSLGEKMVLALLCQIISAPPGVIVVDEPELHLHSNFARKLWDCLQLERADCRFVFATHDLPFAISRKGTIGLVLSPSDVKVLPLGDGVPDHIVEDIVGAATASVCAKRIIFCEGEAGRSIDETILRYWFSTPSDVVLPVGGCSDVTLCLEAFKKSGLVLGCEAIAVVDRDVWPESYFDHVSSCGGIVLPFHEMENLFLQKRVVFALCELIGKQLPQTAYDAIVSKIADRYSDREGHKLALQMAKSEAEFAMRSVLNSIQYNGTWEGTREAFAVAPEFSNRMNNLGNIIDSKYNNVKNALDEKGVKLLNVVPGKECFGLLADALGLHKHVLSEMISTKLFEKERNSLKDAVDSVLCEFLPPRRASE